MATKLCDVCGGRPAAIRVTLVGNGAREEHDVCEHDYRELEEKTGKQQVALSSSEIKVSDVAEIPSKLTIAAMSGPLTFLFRAWGTFVGLVPFIDGYRFHIAQR